MCLQPLSERAESEEVADENGSGVGLGLSAMDMGDDTSQSKRSEKEKQQEKEKSGKEIKEEKPARAKRQVCCFFLSALLMFVDVFWCSRLQASFRLPMTT